MFGLGAMAISALPPLNGFVSEWLVYLGLFDATLERGSAAGGAVAAAILLGVTGALALACFVKVCGVVFLGAQRTEDAERARECGWLMRAGMLLPAAGCVAVGLAPLWFWRGVARAVGEWNPAWSGGVASAAPESLGKLGLVHLVFLGSALAGGAWLWSKSRRAGLRRAPTWDCGYAAPTARMQYTAGSFAGLISGWFSSVLRPVLRLRPVSGLFPKSAAHSVTTPETVLERVVAPVGRGIMRVSRLVRRLQHGRVQSYVLYIFIALAALATWLLAAGGGAAPIP